jgi:hypothetical protein
MAKVVVLVQFRREPDGQRALAQIAQHAVSTKPDLPKHAADVARAGAAAFDFTDVFAGARADEVIAGGETTEEISHDHGAGRLKPVCRLQMFD